MQDQTICLLRRALLHSTDSESRDTHATHAPNKRLGVRLGLLLYHFQVPSLTLVLGWCCSSVPSASTIFCLYTREVYIWQRSYTWKYASLGKKKCTNICIKFIKTKWSRPFLIIQNTASHTMGRLPCSQDTQWGRQGDNSRCLIAKGSRRAPSILWGQGMPTCIQGSCREQNGYKLLQQQPLTLPTTVPAAVCPWVHSGSGKKDMHRAPVN